MKKILLILVAVLTLSILPMNTHAKEKATVYLFRGKTCEHCEEALTYFNNHKSEWEDILEIKTYEVWNNNNNAVLQSKVAEKLNVPENKRTDVPMFVVGDNYHIGYSGVVTYNKIINMAKELNNKEETIDVVENAISENNLKVSALSIADLFGEANPIVTYIVFGIFGLIVIGFAGMIVFSRK